MPKGPWSDFFDALSGKSPGRVVRERKQRELQALIAVAVRRAYQNNRAAQAQVGQDVQYQDGELEVRVKSDYNRDHDCFVTNIIVKPLGRGWHGSHQHVIIDEDGNELMNEWREK